MKVPALLLIPFLLIAEPLPYYHDGATVRIVFPERGGFAESFGLIAGPSPIPLTDLIDSDSPTDTIPTITLTAQAGSELFDPLLNKYEGTNDVNSDHRSSFAGRLELPKIGLIARGLYGYEDRFSQMFDRFSNRQESVANQPIGYSAFGLSEQVEATAIYRGRQIRSAVAVSSRDQWQPIPGFDSLYTYGTDQEIRAVGELNRQRFGITLGGGMRTYADPRVETEERRWNELLISTNVAITPAVTIATGFDQRRENRYDQSLFLTASHQSERCNSEWTTRYFPDDHTFSGDLSGTATIVDPITVSGELHVGSARSAKFSQSLLRGDRFITLFHDSPSRFNGNIAVSLHRSVRSIPIRLTALVLADRYPQYEQIRTDSSAVAITTNPNRKVAAVGSAMEISYPQRWWGITLDGFYRADLLDLPSISTPGFIRTTLRIGKNLPRRLNGTVILEQRAPVERIRFVDHTIMDKKTAWSHGVSGSVNLPVEPPFLRNYIEPTVQISAGPFFFGTESAPHLPGGNPIAPQVTLLMEGKILIRK